MNPTKRKKTTPPRKNPAGLVAKATADSSRVGWIGKLSNLDQVYVNDVIDHVINEPDAPIEAVARALKAELNIKTAVGTISRTIRERMINAEVT